MPPLSEGNLSGVPGAYQNLLTTITNTTERVKRQGLGG